MLRKGKSLYYKNHAGKNYKIVFKVKINNFCGLVWRKNGNYNKNIELFVHFFIAFL